MDVRVCGSCGQERSSWHESGVCYRCHLKSVSLGFTYGRERFHGATIGEQQREIESAAAAQGRKIEKIPERRWI